MDVQRANACLHMFTRVVTIGEPGLFVRFTPKSGHVRCNEVCPLWAKSGHRVDYVRSGSKAATRG
jgi:hypothetical protein